MTLWLFLTTIKKQQSCIAIHALAEKIYKQRFQVWMT